MALLGDAALAMWWDMAPAMRAEFEDWHTHEHFPERLSIPGFRRATRWASADGGPGFFVLYELAGYDVLTSPAYLARLNAPTPWSAKLMPHHANMVRSQARVVASRGGAAARHALSVRLSAAPGHEHVLHAALCEVVETLPSRPGIAGAHLLQTDTPAIAATAEQRIRGLADRAADTIVVVCGYEEAALRRIADIELGAGARASAGAADDAIVTLHSLSVAMLPLDLGECTRRTRLRA
jgi:hypothetical protein